MNDSPQSNIPQLYVGELVDVHIPGLIVKAINQDNEGSVFTLADCNGRRIDIPSRLGFRVSRKIPAEGEPQPGEIWANRYGERYFVQRQGTVSIRLVPATTGGTVAHPWQDVHAGADGPIHRVYQPPAETDGESSL